MKLILFRGRPGTGKTFLSGLLAQRLNMLVLRKDDIYDQVSLLNADHRLRNQATYHVLYAVLKSNLHTGSCIILDFPFQFDEDIDQLTIWCKVNDVELKSILVTCTDEGLWAKRFNQRAINPAPNQLITDFEQLKKHYSNMQLEANDGELLIDSVDNAEKNITIILNFVN